MDLGNHEGIWRPFWKFMHKNCRQPVQWQNKIMRAWGTHKMSENIMFSDKTAKVKFKNITHKMSV